MKKFYLLLLAMICSVGMARAYYEHFSLLGMGTDDWSASSTERPIDVPMDNNANTQYYRILHLTPGDYYFALTNSLHQSSIPAQYGPANNNEVMTVGAAGVFGGYNGSNAWKVTITEEDYYRIIVKEDAGNDENKEWYPTVRIEKNDLKIHAGWNGWDKRDMTRQGDTYIYHQTLTVGNKQFLVDNNTNHQYYFNTKGVSVVGSELAISQTSSAYPNFDFTVPEGEAGDYFIKVKITGEATVNITVVKDMSVVSNLTSLVSNKIELNIDNNETYTLALGTDFSTSSTGTLTFTSNNTSVVTVDANGQITPVAKGNTTITISQGATDAYKAGQISIPVSVYSASYGPSNAPSAPTIPATQVRSIYGNYTPAISTTYNTSNWGSSALTEERSINGTPVRIYTMTNAVIVWGNNGGMDDASIKGNDGYRSGSYTGLDASLMEYLHVDIWCDHVRNFTSIINDNGRGAQGNTTANAWTSYDVPLTGINHGETGIENVRWMKFDGFLADDVVAIANVYFYTTQDGSDTNAPVITSVAYVAESATFTTAQVTVVGTDNVGITSLHFVDATNDYDKSYFVVSGTSINETITLTGLKAGKTYNFTVTAKDATGNETATGTNVQVITPAIEGNGNVFYGFEDRTVNGKISAWGVDYPVKLYYSMKWNANGTVTANLYLEDPNNLQEKIGCVIQILDYVTNNGNPIYYDMIKNNGVFSVTMDGPFEQGKNDFRFRIGAGTTTEHPRQVYQVGAESAPYTRNVTNDNFGTLCLPFDADVEGATLYTIVGKTEDNGILQTITLEEVAENKAEAGKAYIFQATANELTATYTAVAAHDTNAGLVGNLGNAITVPYGDGNNTYVLSNNMFYTVNSDVTIGTNRAYIDGDAIETNAQVQGRRIVLGQNGVEEVTAVENVEATDVVKFIENGVLYIQKNGRVYNAMGQLVK